MRHPLIAANWKMHKTVAETRAFVQHFLARCDEAEMEIVICPPFTALAAAAEALRATPVALGAQTMHWAERGPYTGEISAPMLTDLGVEYVILGHSERRAYCNESDESVARKVTAALAAGLIPIVAVGETLEEHDEGRARERVVSQVRAAFAELSRDDVERVVVAYEPIWAIGTGKSDEPASANAIMGAIRGAVPGLEDVQILYGGSAKPENIAAFMDQDNVDGALVGTASLSADVFCDLITNARKEIS